MTLILTGDDDLKVFRYNHKKTLNWLQAKVERTASALEQTDVHCAAGSQSSTFVRSSKGKETTKGKNETCSHKMSNKSQGTEGDIAHLTFHKSIEKQRNFSRK